MTDYLKTIRERAIQNKQARHDFGYGITTADRYVQRMIDDCGYDSIAKAMNVSHMDRELLLKEASQRLVYCGEEMVVEATKVATSRGSFKDILPKGIEAPEHTLMVIRHVMTSPREDRDRDILRTEGARLDPKAPLLWQHLHHLPIGKVLTAVEHTDKALKVAVALLDLNELTSDAAKLIEAGVLRFSHGFIIDDAEERKEGFGLDIKEFEILEDSLVSVPSNVDAEVELFAAGKLHSDVVKSHAKRLFDERKKSFRGTSFGTEDDDYDGVMRCSKAFRIEGEVLEAAALEYSWASRYIGCEVKDLVVLQWHVPRIMKGSFFEGLRVALAEYEQSDVRNITRGGQETPPLYEHIQLNSRMSGSYLRDGIRFLSGEEKIAIKIEPTYGGAAVVTSYSKSDKADEIMATAWEWARENNFLKGEAFSLMGEFIPRGDQTASDIFLDKENREAITRTINLLGESMPDSRGMIFMGPPGTGKTLAGRVLRNETAATFVWVSSRDFWHCGAAYGICSALDLARSLAPAVVFLEDVDNWIRSTEIDLLKTELDGIAQHKGVVTILTTNYPERLPDTLIDRPGRFHDVLEFKLPNGIIREHMLQAWMPEWTGIDGEEKDNLIIRTDGFSGAHLFELCRYARSLASEKDLGCLESLTLALDKLEAQRALIDESQLAGSRYKPQKTPTDGHVVPACEKIASQGLSYAQTRIKSLDGEIEGLKVRLQESDSALELAKETAKESAALEEKSGRALSSKNQSLLQDVLDDLRELSGAELTRANKALLSRAIKSLEGILESASDGDSNDDDKHLLPQVKDVIEAAQLLISSGDDTLLRRVHKSITALLDVSDMDAQAEKYRILIEEK